jgi:type VI secretion system secreted protein VgrG
MAGVMVLAASSILLTPVSSTWKFNVPIVRMKPPVVAEADLVRQGFRQVTVDDGESMTIGDGMSMAIDDGESMVTGDGVSMVIDDGESMATGNDVSMAIDDGASESVDPDPAIPTVSAN